MPDGWGVVTGARSAHYFSNGRSLCGRWAALNGFRPRQPARRNAYCATCWRKHQKQVAHDRMAEKHVPLGEVQE